MRIGIDARELCGRATGVGRYLSGLLAEWGRCARGRGHEFVLYAPEPPPQRFDTRQFAIRTIPGRAGAWWEQMRAPRAAAMDQLDAWFAPAYSAPLMVDVPIVLAVHDLSFFARPDWFTVREGIRRRWLTRESVARAACVLTISQFSKRELIERLDVAETKIDVIAPGLGNRGSGLGSRPSRVDAGSSAPQSPRVLYVGSLFTRRHVPDLVRAFAPIARAHGARLDLVGDNRTYPHEDIRGAIAAEGLSDHVVWHEYLPDPALAELYARARAFAFLSEYEGLGLTPLEALASGVPPVLLDTPVARESCGDAALYVPLGRHREITRALEAALFDEPTRVRVLAHAPAVLARYDWTRAADQTLAVIEKAAG